MSQPGAWPKPRRKLRRARSGTILLLLIASCLVLPSRSSAAVTPQEVDAAIKRGVDYLWSQQKADGRWELDDHRERIGHDWRTGEGDSFGGFTALSVYALLAADTKKNDPRIIRAVNFLKHAEITGNYALGLRCQVWLNLGNTAETRSLLAADVKRLQNGLGQTGTVAGLWGYWMNTAQNTGTIDHSVSQYGVLGLWAGAQLDILVPPDTWKSIDTAWREQQNADGGWSYNGNGSDGRDSTASMTAAGVASLFIVQDMLHGAMTVAPAHGNFADPKIDAGLNWMSSNFNQVDTNYTWYGVERIGAASGFKYFGKVDWYTRGAETLVATQGKEGQWENSPLTGTPVSNTAFALLFLCHGRAPVMMDKLDYAIGADGHIRDVTWNARHRDAANLARFTGHNMEVLLNWQTVNLASPAEDWHDAPMLYLSGSKALDLTPYEESKLKLYVEQGGMIVANAEAATVYGPAAQRAKAAFPASVRSLGRRLFGRDFRPLPPTHPILAGQSYRSSRWKGEPGIEGLSNGVREMMILLTDDPAHAWQLDSFRSEPAKFELGTDLFLYAVDKQDLRGKGDSYLVHAAAPVKRVVAVARLLVGANPDPEPGGWRRLNAVTINTNGTALDVRYVKLGDGSLLRPLAPLATTEPAARPSTVPATSPATRPATRPVSAPAPLRFRIAHLTGTTAFKLDAAQRKELAAFTAGGGTLIVDAAGGSTQFADSAEVELAAIFGGNPKDIGTVLPPTHPVYRMPGAEITRFGWRLYARERLGDLDDPLIRAIEEGDRATLFYSRQDLSAGIVGESVDGIVGYGPTTATAIMRNLVLYSAK